MRFKRRYIHCSRQLLFEHKQSAKQQHHEQSRDCKHDNFAKEEFPSSDHATHKWVTRGEIEKDDYNETSRGCKTTRRAEVYKREVSEE